MNKHNKRDLSLFLKTQTVIETVISLIGSIVMVFLAAMLFVNTVEYVGCRFALGSSFIGAIISPLFTSFPEMVVFLVAVLVAREEMIGVGTIFGQPFMASSLSYGLVGISAVIGYIVKRRNDLTFEVDRSLIIPYTFVTILFPLTIVPSVIGFHKLFGAIFLASYVYYVWMMYKRRLADIIEEADDLYICRIVPYPTLSIVIQISCSVILLYIGSEKLVESVKELALHTGISEMGLALVIVPAATAIPETASALIWGYRGRDTLSIGALVGEKILYSTFYPGLGLLLTSWVLDNHAYMSVFATTIVSLILLYYIAKQRVPIHALCFGLIFFVSYVILVFILHI